MSGQMGGGRNQDFGDGGKVKKLLHKSKQKPKYTKVK